MLSRSVLGSYNMEKLQRDILWRVFSSLPIFAMPLDFANQPAPGRRDAKQLGSRAELIFRSFSAISNFCTRCSRNLIFAFSAGNALKILTNEVAASPDAVAFVYVISSHSDAPGGKSLLIFQ